MILLASTNSHKIAELSAIFHEYEVVPVGTLFPNFSPEENGNSFLENSLIKAQALWTQLNSPAGKKAYDQQFTGQFLAILAEDSGIAVDALDGRPGIHSARFGQDENGGRLSAAEQNALLLAMLRDTSHCRTARYICCMTLLVNDHRIFTAQESWDGKIASQPSGGGGGFGYDPIFFLPDRGCTAADISVDEKNAISHRGKAAQAIVGILRSHLRAQQT